ncbi:ATP-binding cassette domain-containing protein [Austwickia chelonae]|uniref:ATP-binding cassette domain-containing protein n=1 Tax=Austwickia chelonae TaxID=100225 RepID=UPI000E272485|nr:ATP-binding cassette domain-containing protein [Austwickia chelonae]
MGTVLVELSGVHLSRGGYPVLVDMSLTVPQGRTVALLGHSGVGKSTILRLLDGTLSPDKGTLRYPCGEPRRGAARQSPALFPWATVAENIEIGSSYTVHRRHHDHTLVDELVRVFGLSDLRDRYPDQLSGGQAQRVALARALVVRPELLLLDEPLSAADPSTRAEIQNWLRGFVARHDMTTILVTHDVDEALHLGDLIHQVGPGGRITHSWQPSPDGSDRGKLGEQVRAAYDRIDFATVGADRG